MSATSAPGPSPTSAPGPSPSRATDVPAGVAPPAGEITTSTPAVEPAEQPPSAVPTRRTRRARRAPATAPVPATGRGASRPALVPPGGLVVAGFLVLVAGAWGGIVPFVGASFGYRADHTAAWTWNLPHGLLWLAPGAVAVACGLAMMALARRAGAGGARAGCALTGIGALLAGAWFVVGPFAWPVFQSGSPITAASAARLFVERVGYSFAPGLALVALGAMVAGWAVRPRRLVQAGAVRAGYETPMAA